MRQCLHIASVAFGDGVRYGTLQPVEYFGRQMQYQAPRAEPLQVSQAVGVSLLSKRCCSYLKNERFR